MVFAKKKERRLSPICYLVAGGLCGNVVKEKIVIILMFSYANSKKKYLLQAPPTKFSSNLYKQSLKVMYTEVQISDAHGNRIHWS